MIHLWINFAVIHFCAQEECLLSDPQGESDADADIEDTDCRFDFTPHVSAVFSHSAVPWLAFTSFQTPGAGVAPTN